MNRRRVLRLLSRGTLWVAIAAGSGKLLGRAVDRMYGGVYGRAYWPRSRRRAADDFSPIPWIGHC